MLTTTPFTSLVAGEVISVGTQQNTFIKYHADSNTYELLYKDGSNTWMPVSYVEVEQLLTSCMEFHTCIDENHPDSADLQSLWDKFSVIDIDEDAYDFAILKLRESANEYAVKDNARLFAYFAAGARSQQPE